MCIDNEMILINTVHDIKAQNNTARCNNSVFDRLKKKKKSVSNCPIMVNNETLRYPAK